jgi:5'-3' exonuclease
LYLIDASIYIFRAYFAMPGNWHTSDGYAVNALYGFSRFLLGLLDQKRPVHIAAAFDESLGSCFRNDIYPDYKASRALPDEALAFQLYACQSLTELLGIKSFASPRYEADDIIATLAHRAQKLNQPVMIVSRDKDLGQLLVNDQDQCWDPADDKLMDKVSFGEQFGIRSEQMVDFQALVGDSIDDVPGVPGVGKKTAAALLQQYTSLDKVYANLSDVANGSLRGAKALAAKLAEHREQVMMARQLVKLEQAMSLPKHAHDLTWRPPPRVMLEAFLEEFGLNTLSRQLDRYQWLKTD